jgi:hypothetical protein
VVLGAGGGVEVWDVSVWVERAVECGNFAAQGPPRSNVFYAGTGVITTLTHCCKYGTNIHTVCLYCTYSDEAIQSSLPW